MTIANVMLMAASGTKISACRSTTALSFFSRASKMVRFQTLSWYCTTSCATTNATRLAVSTHAIRRCSPVQKPCAVRQKRRVRDFRCCLLSSSEVAALSLDWAGACMRAPALGRYSYNARSAIPFTPRQSVASREAPAATAIVDALAQLAALRKTPARLACGAARSPMTTDSEIVFERRGAAGLVTLNRPQALNAVTHNMVRALAGKL